jgi:hypothetical protein
VHGTGGQNDVGLGRIDRNALVSFFRSLGFGVSNGLLGEVSFVWAKLDTETLKKRVQKSEADWKAGLSGRSM